MFSRQSSWLKTNIQQASIFELCTQVLSQMCPRLLLGAGVSFSLHTSIAFTFENIEEVGCFHQVYLIINLGILDTLDSTKFWVRIFDMTMHSAMFPSQTDVFIADNTKWDSCHWISESPSWNKVLILALNPWLVYCKRSCCCCFYYSICFCWWYRFILCQIRRVDVSFVQ